ncbi:hypothetical protein F3Y22_tig00110109pilonHSYRG00192 [Hibiscus syriacus]|uniref:Uncharacterized protein n=1 Tax=Hibiscus syriacus TaxID=106335 RepID=A0A6A3BKJ5_HIBSY|nr:hypothetical protein F3Y22_tig00110109pilonHSYRG00192 [Hibiscus syriacus]
MEQETLQISLCVHFECSDQRIVYKMDRADTSGFFAASIKGMDLNKNAQFSHVSELSKNENFGDTILCLNFIGYGGSNKARCGTISKNLHVDLSSAADDGCRLVLGLGPTPSVYLDNYYNVGLSKNKSTTALFTRGVSAEDSELSIPIVDEGSTSTKKSDGYMPSLLFAPKMESRKALVQTQDFFNNRASNSKKCKFAGCSKGARGASGLCIGHGEDKDAKHQGVTKVLRAALPTIPGGCVKAARGNWGFASDMVGERGERWKVAHVVPKDMLVCASLMVVDAVASSRDALRVLREVIARPMVVGNAVYSQGVPKVLKEPRCGAKDMVRENVASTTVVAFVPRVCLEAPNSVLHMVVGSGVLCQAVQRVHTVELIVVSGMVMLLGKSKCEKFARGRSGLCAAHSSMVKEREASKGGHIAPGVFHGLVSTAAATRSSRDNNHPSSGTIVISDGIDSLDKSTKRQQLMPPQVLVPLSMKSSSSYSSFFDAEKQEEGRNGYNMDIGGGGGNNDFSIPEGRVHGGGLMSLLGVNLTNPFDGI